MKNKILMIAYHYPPVGSSSGVHRSLKFSQYLPSLGWQPTVLSVNPKAYDRTSDYQLKDIPNSVHVKRAFALDTARHLAIKGRYPDIFALPDRWVSWLFGGIISGVVLIKRFRPNVIWSTYPIATAHLIGLILHKLTGIPWVADFRDSMTEETYPKEKSRWKAYRWIEEKAVKHASKLVFTTQGTLEMYRNRYPEADPEKFCVIENGYDEDNFKEIEISTTEEQKSQLTLIHSGLLYPSERDPRDFFMAISELKRENQINRNSLKVVLRASGHEDYYEDLIHKMDINDIIFLAKPIPYGDALKEMIQTDGLLIFQASNCNHQIPAKIYEYLRAKRPIFALTDKAGDTANVLKRAGIYTIVPLDNKDAIKKGLIEFIKSLKENNAPIASDEQISQHSREAKTREFSQLLDSIT